MRLRASIFLAALLAASLACQTVLPPDASPAPATAAPAATADDQLTEAPAAGTPTAPELSLATEPASPDRVRECLYKPGNPVADLPAEAAFTPTPPAIPSMTPPAPTKVDAETTARQLRVLEELWTTVDQVYVYPDFNGQDWPAIGDRYRALVRAGVADADFYHLMQAMVYELGDDHSEFLDPEAAKAEDSPGRLDYVGIGALVVRLPNFGPQGEAGVITSVFRGSPAEAAGLRPHDLILQVDGGPLFDAATGDSRTLGPENTPVTVTIQRPGEAPRDLTLTRGRVGGDTPLDYCLVPGTRIGYIYFPTFNDETIDDQTRAALQAMTADGPLAGLILDNRLNGGGSSTVADPIMSFFASGWQGDYISRGATERLEIQPNDVGGSQTVPLVVLIGPETASYAEIVSGVLRLAGRATLVGQTTMGLVERKFGYDFEDGSRAWIVAQTFQPRGQANGVWHRTGVSPDVDVATRWELFTEANDPAIARAVELLQAGTP